MRALKASRLKLTTTQGEFEDLHQRIDAKRRSARDVSVPIEALKHLLHDHSKMTATLGIEGYEEP